MSVVVNNYTSQWLYIRGADHYVEPYHGGVILPMDGAQVGEVIVQAPPGFLQQPLNPGEVASISWYADPQPYNPGYALETATPHQVIVFSKAFAGGAVLGSQNFAIPIGTIALCAFTDVNSIGNFIVLGNQSGNSIIPFDNVQGSLTLVGNANGGSPIYGLVSSTKDITCSVGGTVAAGSATTLTIVAIVKDPVVNASILTLNGQVVAPASANVTSVPVSNSADPTYFFRAEALSTGALGAAGDKVMLSITDAGAAQTRHVRLQRLFVSFDSVSAATILTLRLIFYNGTTQPSGGTAIVPSLQDAGGSAQALVMSLPTTAGAAESGIPVAYGRQLYGIVAGSVSELYRAPYQLVGSGQLPRERPPGLPTGSGNGWNLHITTSIAATIVMNVWGTFTET